MARRNRAFEIFEWIMVQENERTQFREILPTFTVLKSKYGEKKISFTKFSFVIPVVS